MEKKLREEDRVKTTKYFDGVMTMITITYDHPNPAFKGRIITENVFTFKKYLMPEFKL